MRHCETRKESMIKVLRYKAEHIKTKIKPEFFNEVADVLEQEPCEDTISRAEAVKVASGYCHPSNIVKELEKLSPVTPKMGHCKDCKRWKDSDGTYRRGVGAESQCPINSMKVFEGNGYCYMFEPQESEE